MKKKGKTIINLLFAIIIISIAIIPNKTTNAAVGDIGIESVVLDSSNRLKSISFNHSWMGGNTYISFVLLDDKIGYNGPDSLYEHFCTKAEASTIQYTFEDSLRYMEDLYGSSNIANTGDPITTNNQMKMSVTYSGHYQQLINFDINNTIDANYSDKVYLYQWALDGACNDGYYPDALVAVFKMEEDGLYYAIGDNEPNDPNKVIKFTYTITFDRGTGASGGTESIQVKAGEDEQYPKLSPITIPHKDDYVFDGYYDGENGTGTKYYDSNGNNIVQNWDKNSSATLYAKWIKSTTSLDITVQKDDETFIYDGDGKEPILTVKDGDKILVEGIDYDLEFVGREPTDYPQSEIPPVMGGDYTAIIIFKGDYDGTREVPFSIEPAPLTDITFEDLEIDYDGKEHGINPSGELDDTTILYSLDGETYTEEMPKFKDVGEYTVYFKVSKEGYEDLYGSATLTINKVEKVQTMDSISKYFFLLLFSIVSLIGTTIFVKKRKYN